MIFDLKKNAVSAELSHPVSKEEIKIVDELKILGFWLTSTLNYQKTIDEKCKNARRCLWTLIRLREAQFPIEKLVHIYCLNIRSIMEYLILAILPGLNRKQINQLESVQRKATQSILRDYEMTYNERLKLCKLEKLECRWERQFVKFAIKTVQSQRFKNWIKPNNNTNEMNLRKQNTFYHPQCKTERYRKSTINTIIRAVNNFRIIYED